MNDTPSDASAWRPIFDVHTDDHDFEQAIVAQIGESLFDFGAVLAADADLTPAQRAAVLKKAAPFIRAQTRRAFVSARARLRAEAAD